MNSRNPDFVITTATPQELQFTLKLAFTGATEVDSVAANANALALLERGELDRDGIFVIRRRGEVAGAIMALAAPGAVGILWPPASAPGNDRAAMEAALVVHALSWLRSRGAKIVQCLVLPEDAYRTIPLLLGGFTRITQLWLMRHDLVADIGNESRLDFENYRFANQTEFHQVLQRTYGGTLDCPEVNGVRTIDEVIAGHAATGRSDSPRWWLARANRDAIGVVMLAKLPEPGIWDLSYIGVVPEARGRGHGQRLIAKAIREARQACGLELTLAVDARNEHAIRLYQTLGFEKMGQRELYLFIAK